MIHLNEYSDAQQRLEIRVQVKAIRDAAEQALWDLLHGDRYGFEDSMTGVEYAACQMREIRQAWREADSKLTDAARIAGHGR